MNKSNTKKRNWCNLNEKINTTFFLIVKMTKSNTEKKLARKLA